MSEYQYYEFRAVDEPLSERQMQELRSLSTRARITATGFTNFYTFGDFKGNPDRLIEQYFDAFVYTANWGSNEFMLRLPLALLDTRTAALYCAGQGASCRIAGQHLILEFISDNEGSDDDFDGGEGWMSALLPLRADLIHGDLRCLYLGWLLCVQNGGVDSDELEPPVPAGLGKLTGPLQSFADVLRIDPHLIAAAARVSSADTPAGPDRNELDAWVKCLSRADLEDIAHRLVAGEASHLSTELLGRFRQEQRGKSIAKTTLDLRTVSELLAAAEELEEAAQRRQAEQQRQQREKQRKEEEAARAKYLDVLAKREPQSWREVERLIGKKQAYAYDQAIQLLKDLRDLSKKHKRTAEFQGRIQQLREQHAAKGSLISKLDKARLGHD